MIEDLLTGEISVTLRMNSIKYAVFKEKEIVFKIIPKKLQIYITHERKIISPKLSHLIFMVIIFCRQAVVQLETRVNNKHIILKLTSLKIFLVIIQILKNPNFSDACM